MRSWLLLPALGVLADLPIHCTYENFSGEWELHHYGEESDIPQSCDSSFPNSNLVNVSLESALIRRISSTNDVSRKLTLTTFTRLSSGDRDHWRELVVKGDFKGKWTSIYDQGFEIKLENGDSYLVVSEYKNICARSFIQNSDQTDESGSTPCYQSSCHLNKFGFGRRKDEHGKLKYFCFAAKKVGSSSEDDENGVLSSIPVKAIVAPKKIVNPISDKPQTSTQTISIQPHQSSSPRRRLSSSSAGSKPFTSRTLVFPESRQRRLSVSQGIFFGGNDDDDGRPSTYACPVRGGFYSDADSSAESAQSSSRYSVTSSTEYDALLKTTSSVLPEVFSWVSGIASNDASNPHALPLSATPVTDQLSCGSCYAIGAAHMLNYRFKIAAVRKNLDPQLIPESFSVQDQLECDFYGQGCEGGFPVLSARFAFESGLIDATSVKSYDPRTKGGDLLHANPPKNIEICLGNTVVKGEKKYSPSDRFFSSDYGYVGGFYEAGDYRVIQKEIFDHGPVAIAFKVPDNFSDAELETVFTSDDYKAPGRGERQCPHSKEPFSPPESVGIVNGWQYTDHAVVIVGWDVALQCPVTHKAWIIKNSWGGRWGKKGFSKVCMGQNLGGIENQAYYSDPDFSRGAGSKLIQRV